MTNYSHHMPYATEEYGSNRFSGEYAKVSEGLGAYAEVVKTPDELGPSITRGIAATKKRQPAVLEMITKEELDVAKFW